MSRRRILTGALVGMLVVLGGFSVYLAITRIYQVDECQNLYMAMVLASGKASEFFTNGSLFLLGPLSWITRGCTNSENAFAYARFLYLLVFWLNLLLLAAVASGRLWSTQGLIVFAAAATLAPLWDYGFEIRHDNLLLTGILLTWWTVRVRPIGKISYAVAGGIFVSMLFIAVKSIVYVLPLSLAILAFPPPGHKQSRRQLGLAWCGGAILAAVLIRLSYGATGMWDVYFSVFQGVTKLSVPGNSTNFWPWPTLRRLLWQIPLLLAVTTAACAALAVHLRRNRRAALTWEGNLPECLLLIGALAGLLANPTPFPYNLVHVVPYAFVLGFRYGAAVWQQIGENRDLRRAFVAILLFAHLVPFGLVTRRHLDRSNDRQKTLMRLAEDLTDPAKDPVYDGIGMVPSRSTIHFLWYLHSLNMQTFLSESGPHVRDILATRPPAVLIQSYRTDLLPDVDHDFIKTRYIPLADDFWVLGTVLPSCTDKFEVVHPGRYQIGWIKNSENTGTNSAQIKTIKEDQPFTCKLDGAPLSQQVVELGVGIHQIETSSDRRATVTWLGPRLNQVPQLSARSRQALFVNWY